LSIYLNIFFIFLCVSFFPIFVIGVSYTNYLIALFLLVSIIYNYRNIKNLFLENINFSICFLFFYLILLISSLLSDYLLFSLKTSFLYFLYLLFIFSIMNLFRYEKFQIIFYFSGLITFLIISLDGLFEIFNGDNIIGNYAIPGRLSGFFGERWVIGSYLVRFLPVLVAIFIFNYSRFNRLSKVFSFLVFLLSSIIIVFSGERTAYLLFLFYIILNLIFLIKYTNLKLLYVIAISFLLIFIIPFFNSDHSGRLNDKIIFYLTTFSLEDNQYLALYSTALKIFVNNPILGSGPNTFRIVCGEDIFNISYFSCSTHPHNILIQLLSETGVLGTLFVSSLFIFCLVKIKSILNLSKFDLNQFGFYSLLSAIILNLLPFVPSGNFFLSWNGYIFMCPIAIYLFFTKKI
jgi:O-antigen ligase